MTTPTTADRVRKIIREHLGVNEAPDTAHLITDLGADSLDEVARLRAREARLRGAANVVIGKDSHIDASIRSDGPERKVVYGVFAQTLLRALNPAPATEGEG